MSPATRRLAILPLLLTLIAAADPDPAPAPVTSTAGAFESDGKRIGIERFEPAAEGPFPVVVILHGSTGPGLSVGSMRVRDLARELASRGYVTVIPRYFDRTGDLFVADRATMEARFRVWAETVADATTFALESPKADPDRVGLVGISLGAYLSLAVSTYDPRVKVVVDYFGGLPDQLADRADKLPPTLILHGDADPIVPVAEARKLDERLESFGIPHASKIYPGAGHGFTGEAAADALRRTLAFLGEHLGRLETTTVVASGPDSE